MGNLQSTGQLQTSRPLRTLPSPCHLSQVAVLSGTATSPSQVLFAWHDFVLGTVIMPLACLDGEMGGEQGS